MKLVIQMYRMHSLYRRLDEWIQLLDPILTLHELAELPYKKKNFLYDFFGICHCAKEKVILIILKPETNI